MTDQLLPLSFSRSLHPHQVEYRLAVGQGVKVVLVLLYGSEPRIMSWSEKFGPAGREKEPMSLGLSEIQNFCVDAREVLGL